MVRVVSGIGRMALVTGAVALMATVAQAKGDVQAGAQVFKQCSICHSDAKGAPNKIGPNLWGVIGRKAGTEPGFNYSPAMKKAGESGLVWNEETLEAYVRHPQQTVPGNKMPFGGLSSGKQADDVAAYIETLK